VINYLCHVALSYACDLLIVIFAICILYWCFSDVQFRNKWQGRIGGGGATGKPREPGL